jgi:hypothetical protein
MSTDPTRLPQIDRQIDAADFAPTLSRFASITSERFLDSTSNFCVTASFSSYLFKTLLSSLSTHLCLFPVVVHLHDYINRTHLSLSALLLPIAM